MYHLRFSETELCAMSSPAIWRRSVKLQRSPSDVTCHLVAAREHQRGSVTGLFLLVLGYFKSNSIEII